MRFWRALGISILGYYLLGLVQILVALALRLDLRAPSLPWLFWITSTLVSVAVTFGLMHWYFRAHEFIGIRQGFYAGLFFVGTGIVLDIIYVIVRGEYSALSALFASYLGSLGFILQVLAIIFTAAFVGEAHHRHRGKKRKR
ncbi:hypothetical protein FJZ22_00090 [Candidatus Pacearchaeota archaeon]|nr:hypothetical protein [Candidatus Pacearchaeota archaeon]